MECLSDGYITLDKHNHIFDLLSTIQERHEQERHEQDLQLKFENAQYHVNASSSCVTDKAKAYYELYVFHTHGWAGATQDAMRALECLRQSASFGYSMAVDDLHRRDQLNIPDQIMNKHEVRLLIKLNDAGHDYARMGPMNTGPEFLRDAFIEQCMRRWASGMHTAHIEYEYTDLTPHQVAVWESESESDPPVLRMLCLVHKESECNEFTLTMVAADREAYSEELELRAVRGETERAVYTALARVIATRYLKYDCIDEPCDTETLITVWNGRRTTSLLKSASFEMVCEPVTSEGPKETETKTEKEKEKESAGVRSVFMENDGTVVSSPTAQFVPPPDALSGELDEVGGVHVERLQEFDFTLFMSQ